MFALELVEQFGDIDLTGESLSLAFRLTRQLGVLDPCEVFRLSAEEPRLRCTRSRKLSGVGFSNVPFSSNVIAVPDK